MAFVTGCGLFFFGFTTLGVSGKSVLASIGALQSHHKFTAVFSNSSRWSHQPYFLMRPPFATVLWTKRSGSPSEAPCHSASPLW